MYRKLFCSVFILSMLCTNNLLAYADCDRIEHLNIHPESPCNEVIINGCTRTIKEGNVLLFAFNEQFYSKNHCAGDIVHFLVPEAIYTEEGTMILPANAKVVAEVTSIEKPKMFNKNARVSLIFRRIVFPDNSCIEIKARPFTCDHKLKEGPWVTAGKVLLSTITLGAVGTGAGVGFAFIPHPSRIATGLAIGIPVGCGVGLALGLITPGCHYKAKCGEQVYAILLESFCVEEIR